MRDARLDRMKKMQKWIAKGVTRQTDLAKKLGVSSRTVHNMLNQLKDQGVDVFALAPAIDAEHERRQKKKKPKNPEKAEVVRMRKSTRTTVRQYNELIGRQINILDQLNAINLISQKAADVLQQSANKDPKLYGLVLKACSEIRSQLEFGADLVKMLYDAQAVQEFQEEVLEVIGSVDLDVRREIEYRLKERRALRGAVQFPGEVRRDRTGEATDPSGVTDI